MWYYRLEDKDGAQMGAVPSSNFRCYNRKRKRMYAVDNLRKAQYVTFKGKYYAVTWLIEDETIIGKYPKIDAFIISYEEYKKIIEMENEK